MRPTTIALGFLSLFLPVVSAFHISGNETEGGLYKVYLDASGNEIHELVTPATINADAQQLKEAALVQHAPATPDRHRNLNAYPTQRVFCGCGIAMNSRNCDDAVANMKEQIRNRGGTISVPTGQSYYAVRGGVVAFVCSRPGNTAVTPVTEQLFGELLEVVTYLCGRYVPGTFKHGTPIDSAAVDVGYMLSGGDFCGSAESSSRDSC
ncbi:hypothetical protein QBC44DRAFT_241638 [Cladorrhinum sp. PSN332]|nr:hypothetical protein QBC44DRAFT_241638 [Cladorrhinum sp. PSN332]